MFRQRRGKSCAGPRVEPPGILFERLEPRVLLAGEAAPMADLVIESVVITPPANYYDTPTVTVKVKNQGDAATTGRWRDKITHSDNDVDELFDRELATHSIPSGFTLQPGESYEFTESLDYLSGRVTQNYLIVTINVKDITSKQAESDRTNNTRAIAVDWDGPDLIVSRAAAPSVWRERSPMVVEWTVLNQGEWTLPTGEEWLDGVYISDDPTWNLQDTQIGAVRYDNRQRDPDEFGDELVPYWGGDRSELSSHDSYTTSLVVSVPEGHTGAQYLLFKVSNWYWADKSWANNVFAIPIEILPRTEDYALSFENFRVGSANARTRQFSVSYNLHNTGAEASPGNRVETVYVAREPYTGVHDLQAVAATQFAPVAPGRRARHTLRARLPEGFNNPYFRVNLFSAVEGITLQDLRQAIVPADNPAVELGADEQRKPSLSATVISLAPTWNPWAPGDTIQTSLLFRNEGTGSFRGRVKVELFASTDDTLDAGDLALAPEYLYIDVDHGSSTTAGIEPKLPPDLKPGMYRFIVKINDDGLVEELAPESAADNVSAGAETFEVAWRFGSIDGKRNVPLTVMGDDQRLVTLTLRGRGAGEFDFSGGTPVIKLIGTDRGTTLNWTPVDGDPISIGDLELRGTLGAFLAPKAELLGDVTFKGLLGRLTVAGAVGRTLRIEAGENTRKSLVTALTLGSVRDWRIVSDTTLNLVSAKEWLNNDETEDTIIAPLVRRLAIRARGFRPAIQAPA